MAIYIKLTTQLKRPPAWLSIKKIYQVEMKMVVFLRSVRVDLVVLQKYGVGSSMLWSKGAKEITKGVGPVCV